MIRKLFLILTISIIYPVLLRADKCCELTLQIEAPSCAGKYVKFGHYYGLKSLLIDSARVDDNGKTHFARNVHPGIYLLRVPDGMAYELMVAETSNLTVQMMGQEDQRVFMVTGNEITEAFNSYLNEVRSLEFVLDSLKLLGDQTESYPEKLALQRLAKSSRVRMDSITRAYSEKYQGTLLGSYLTSLIPIKLPSFTIPPGISNPDSFRWKQSHQYFQKHYLDHVNFEDNGLIYTPVLEDKVISYFDRIIEQRPVLICEAVDTLLLKLKDPEVSEYLTGMLLEKYGRAKHKALDEYVYVHIIKDYYLSGKAFWADNQEIRLLTEDYNRHKPASLLQNAPAISLPDQYNRPQSLDQVDSKYTVIIFWDYDCPYCRRALDDLRKVIQRYSHQEIHVFTIFIGEDVDVWKAFLARKIPKEWINTRLDGKTSLVRQYNLTQTPAIFLLDSNKTIVDKNLTAAALDDYLKENM